MALLAQTKYFPPGAHDQSVSDWYSKQLQALEEPSLWELSKTQGSQSYRFLWLRTFHHPVAIRLDINADGTSRLTTKMTSGAGGYGPGKLTQNDVTTMTKERTDWFLEQIERNSFWTLASRDETRFGKDGAQWIVEGVKNGNYHIVDRWSPKDGEVRAIGLAMIKELAKLDVAPKQVY
jgi:hypothetical protein